MSLTLEVGNDDLDMRVFHDDGCLFYSDFKYIVVVGQRSFG